jgi:hypothetical protein
MMKKVTAAIRFWNCRSLTIRCRRDRFE